MKNFRFLFLYAQIIVSGMSLLVGGVLWLNSAFGWADQLWLAGALWVSLWIISDIGKSILNKESGLDVLALISIAGAMLLGEMLTAAVIAFMYASGRALENFAQTKARKNIEALLSRVPQTATRSKGGELEVIPLTAIVAGDLLLVRSGEFIPADGYLLSGEASVDESALTGESLPVTKASADMLASGTINAGNAFTYKAAAVAADSTYMRVIQLVERAQTERSPVIRLASRYALWFIPFALLLAGAAWLFSHDPHRALAVIVVATPCPLILAVPVAMISGISRCAQHGILVKNGAVLEKAAEVDSLFLDKTGTLTGGSIILADIKTAPGFEPDAVLRLAFSLEQMSSHIIARAVVNAATERGLCPLPASQISEMAGQGVSGLIGGRMVRAGQLDFVLDQAAQIPEWLAPVVQSTEQSGYAGVYVVQDGQLAGVLRMADRIRLEAPRALRLLRAEGIRSITMLTGDRPVVAAVIGQLLGVDRILAEQTPAGKLDAISSARRDACVMMVGDGINDAPALAAADIGVAMGAKGAAAAAESAHMVLLADRIDRLVLALRIAKRTRKIAMQSMSLGMGLSIAGMLLAATGWLSPFSGAVLQEVIDVIAILNALRALNSGQLHPVSLSADEIKALREEHTSLLPIVDRLGWLADNVGALSTDRLKVELSSLNSLITGQILPHETDDDVKKYPHIARLIGGEDPMAAMSSTHREILRLSRTISQLSERIEHGEYNDMIMSECRRSLYSLEAILRLHFEQEDEIYHGVAI